MKQLESGHFTFCKCYIQGAPRTKQYHCFFRGAHKISKKWLLQVHFGLIVAKQNKKKLEWEHYTFWKCYIQGAPRNKL